MRALLILVRVFGQLRAPVSRGFAAVLNFGTTPFNLVNYWGSRLGALAYNRNRMGPKLDRAINSLQRHLRRENTADLARSMSYPTRWDPFFTPTMTLADVYHYPTQHFDFHRRQLSGPLCQKQATSSDTGVDRTTGNSCTDVTRSGGSTAVRTRQFRPQAGVSRTSARPPRSRRLPSALRRPRSRRESRRGQR